MNEPDITNPEPECLIVANLGLATTIANDYRNIPGVTLDDLVQVARIALTKAARAYDASLGVPFAAYAGRAIRNALNSLYGVQTRVTRAESASLDEPADEQGRSWHDLLAAELGDDALPLERTETRHWISEMLTALPERQRTTLLGFMAGKSGEEIGRELGISRQAVNAILRDTFVLLRQRLHEKGFRGQESGVLYAGERARVNAETDDERLFDDLFPDDSGK